MYILTLNILLVIADIKGNMMNTNLTISFQAKKVQESHARAAAATREVEILRNNMKSLKGQLQQLQELLATREQEHR